MSGKISGGTSNEAITLAGAKKTKKEKIVFREPRFADLESFLSNINEFVREEAHIGQRELVTRKEESKWLSSQIKQIRQKNLVWLAAVIDGRIVGSCEVRRSRLQRKSRVGELGIGLISAGRGKGIGEKLMLTTIKQAKEVLGVYQIHLTVFANNTRARKLYKKMGFSECGCYPKCIEYKGELIDEILMYKFV